MRNGGRGNTAHPFECDVGLGLKMQDTDSYSSPSHCGQSMPYNDWNDGLMAMGGGCGGGAGHGGYTSCYDSGCGSHVNDSRAAASPDFLSTSDFLQSSSKSFDEGGSMSMVEASGKGFFTAIQWEELKRQTNICKYMIAQIPVPPHLLSTSHVPLSKSNSGGLDLRFSNGSDAEPWRCRRTDGKKWRCSRDVAPDHKYCERHTHKNRPRSRKPVELHSHSGNLKNNYTLHPCLPSPSSSLQSSHKPVPHLPNMVSAAATCESDQPRYSEWLMKTGVSGSGTTSTTPQQFQELLQTGNKRDKNQSVFQQGYEKGPGSSSIAFAATRQHLGASNLVNNCSLTLSMQSGGNIGFEQDNQNYSTEEKIIPHTQWLNSTEAWIGSGSAPGGPLGEALCLGIASNTTTTSTSYDDGLHALNFIR